ncbi:MAG TPA: hydrolase [Microbacterium sp.]|nr:hydrolase [Microbacterium sp.]
MRRTLILDFDGTVCLGDGPALAYARGLAAAHPELADLEHRVARHLAGDAVAEFAGAADGYQAVQSAAVRRGVEPSAIQNAFHAARRLLSKEGLGVHTPDGFADWAVRVRRAGAEILLVTNAPAAGLDGVLRLLGIEDSFDRVVADAGKPEGMHAVLDDVAARNGPITPGTVLSVGDIWVNDLSVPHARTAATALIDPHGRQAGTPDVRVGSFTDLYMWSEAWAHGTAAGEPESSA